MIQKTSVIILFFLQLLLLISSCKKSDDSPNIAPNGKTQINIDAIESADVYAPNFWAKTNLVWNDEFDGNTLSDDKWLLENFPGDINNSTNPDLQDYVGLDNVDVSNGTLKIIAKKIGPGQQQGDYTSARLNGKFAFKYGRMEVRAKMPPDSGNGLFVKLWMLGNNIGIVGYPTCGAIDLLDYYSYLPNEYSTSIFTAENSAIQKPDTSGALSLPSAEEEFHIYGLLYTDRYLKFYLDNIYNIIYTYNRPTNPSENNWPFTQSFYFLMNIAVGGEFGATRGRRFNFSSASRD